MGNEDRETQGVTRVQHIVLHGPADGRTMAAALRPGIERSREALGNATPSCLVVAPTVEQALAAADQARTLLDDDAQRVVPVTAVARARRVLEAAPVAIVTGTAQDLLALRGASGINLESLRAIALIGLDEMIADGAQATLEGLLADAPVDAMRIATLDSESAESEAFLDAHLRRARRVSTFTPGEAVFAITPRYAIGAPGSRGELLRAVLDEIDPPSLVIVATTESGETDARRALTRLGVATNGESVIVTQHAPRVAAALVVLWEAPAGVEALTEALAGQPANAIAFLLPDEVPSFHRLTGGLPQPWIPTVKKDSIESRTRMLRTALRSTLANGGASASELALLAPLLESHDALEIAAAALRLYEGARRETASMKKQAPHLTPLAGGASRPSTRSSGPLSLVSAPSARQKVFLAVGKRDGARVGDLVGAIANEAGIDGERIGSVELFESHATVELDASDAKRVVETMSETMVRGRRLGARIDERTSGGGATGDRATRGHSASDRPARSERPARGRGFDRDDRSSRNSERSERPVRRGSSSDRDDRSSRGPGQERSERVSRSRFSAGVADERRERPGRKEYGAPRSDRNATGERAPRGGTSRTSAPERSSDRSFGSGGARGTPRAADVRRAFSDRPVRERTEATKEWAERGERVKNAKRPPRKSTPESSDEG